MRMQKINKQGREIVDWFRATAHAINQKRDTYYYAVAASATTSSLLFGEVGNGLKFLGAAIGLRELARAFAWIGAERAYIPAGEYGHKPDHKSLGLLPFSIAILAPEALSVSYQTIAGRSWSGGTTNLLLDIGLIGIGVWTSYSASLGPTGAGLKSYPEVMWNYPSKVFEETNRKSQMSAANEIIRRLEEPIASDFPTYEQIVGPDFRSGQGKASGISDGPT